MAVLTASPVRTLIAGAAAQVALFVGLAVVTGLGPSGWLTGIAYVAIGRSMPEELRPRMFALMSTAWALPGVIGPAIAGIASAGGMRERRLVRVSGTLRR